MAFSYRAVDINELMGNTKFLRDMLALMPVPHIARWRGALPK